MLECLLLAYLLRLLIHEKYSLVLNERHLQKEGYDCTLKLCIEPIESDDF